MTTLTNAEAAALHESCAAVTDAIIIPFKARYAIARTLAGLLVAVRAYNEGRQAIIKAHGFQPSGSIVRTAENAEAFDAMAGELEALAGESVDVTLHQFKEADLGEPALSAFALSVILRWLVVEPAAKA